MDLSNLTQSLSDLHIVSIVWFTVALTIIRLAFIKMSGPVVRTVVEIVEAALIAGVLVFLVIQPFIVKAFYIPSGSMLQTLILNDHLLVNRYLYRFESPHRGDIVVFNAPPQALATGGENVTGEDHIDYIKRLIGLPGDTIQVVAGMITINGIVYHHAEIRQAFNAFSADGSTHLKFVKNGIQVYDGTKWTFYSAQEVATKIYGSPNVKISISPGYVIRNGQRLTEPYIAEDPDYSLKIGRDADVIVAMGDGSTRVNGAPTQLTPQQQTDLQSATTGKVPAGDVFVMGDNRNDSNDSTAWGPLTEDRLVGKAIFIFYPFNRIRCIR